MTGCFVKHLPFLVSLIFTTFIQGRYVTRQDLSCNLVMLLSFLVYREHYIDHYTFLLILSERCTYVSIVFIDMETVGN